MNEKGQVEKLVHSLAKYSDKVLLVLSSRSDVSSDTNKIGPVLIFERLWKKTGIPKVVKRLLSDRKFQFDVERALFLTVLHRLMVSGSDRFCSRWKRDYIIHGTEEIELHHLYRAMEFIGEELKDQTYALPFSPRCTKDLIEEDMFFERRDLFSGLDMAFLTPPLFILKASEEQALVNAGIPRIIGPTLSKW